MTGSKLASPNGSGQPTTATVLFTDLVGSTQLRVELGEEQADRLRHEHDVMLRTAVEANNGTVVKGGGDGVMAAFSSASDALSAAVAGQQALFAYSALPEAIAPLDVRMGLSVGDVSWEDGDCFGTPVVEAARLEAAAGGGQILCSDLVRALARGRGGHEFEDLGFMELKGLPEPIPVCAVTWEPDAAPRPLQLPLPAPLRMAADDPAFVGREPHVEVIEEFAAQDGIRLVWLVGEPGAGKTRLAAEVASRSHDAGGLVLFGRCDADVRAPYRPFVEALSQLANQVPVDELRSMLGPHAPELVRLVPELHQLLSVDEAPDAPDAEVGRWRLLEAIRGAFANVALGSNVLLVIDDMHWATESTVQTLRHLVRSSAAPTITIMATVRHTEPGDERVRDVMADVADEAFNLEVAVDGLRIDDVEQLAQLQQAGLDHVAAADLLKNTAGNALFVRTLLRSGDASTGSRDVQSVVRRRLSRLPEPALEALRVASVLGLEADARLVAAVLDVSVAETVADLDEARDSGLVEPGMGSAYRFVHALVRDAMRGEVSAAAQALLHLRVAEVLDDQPSLVSSISMQAHHWRAAVPAGADHGRVVALLDQAAAEAQRQHDWERVSGLLTDAIELAGGLTEPTARPLALRAGKALRMTAKATDQALQILGELAEAAWAAGEDELAADAVIQHSWTRVYSTYLSTEALALTGRARERSQDGTHRRRLLDAFHSVNLARLGHLEEADQIWTDAVAAARAAEDWIALARLLGYAHHTALTPSGISSRFDLLVESHELADRLGDRVGAVETMISLAIGSLACGRHEEVKPALLELLEFQELEAAPAQRYAAATVLVPMLVAGGDFAEAERVASELEDFGRDFSTLDARGIYGLHMFSIRREQGRLGPLLPLMRQIMASGETLWRAGVAVIAAAGGEVEECADQLDHFIVDGKIELPPDVTKTGSVAFLADAAALVGDAQAAKVLWQELLPEAGFHIVMFPCSFGPVNRVLGLLSRVIGELDRSVAECEAAVEESRSARTPVYEARSRLELASTLAERGGDGDSARSRSEAATALEIAERLGMADVAERSSQLLENHQ